VASDNGDLGAVVGYKAGITQGCYGMISTASSTSRRFAIICLVLTAVLWSSSGLLIKVVSWQPLSILSGRSMIASFVILIYLRRFDFHWTRWQIAGAVSFAAAQSLFIMATKLTTAANAIFLQYTAPVYIVLLGYWLLRERPKRADWLAMPVIFTGLSLFFGDDLDFDGLYGNALAIFSGVALALMILSMRSQKEGVPANIILVGNIIGAFIGLPSLVQETWTISDAGIILFLGVFQIGLSFILYSIAIKQVQALESTLILTLEPILNPIWVFLVLGEVPGGFALVGGTIVVGAVTARAIVSAQAVDDEAV
jgi:drug/metabolite transporter (DMT)-like permease